MTNRIGFQAVLLYRIENIANGVGYEDSYYIVVVFSK